MKLIIIVGSKFSQKKINLLLSISIRNIISQVSLYGRNKFKSFAFILFIDILFMSQFYLLQTPFTQ